MGSYLMNEIMFWPLFLLMYISSFWLVLGGDSWFILWCGLEVNMMSFIILIYGKGILSIESSMKYFFIQGVGSGFLLSIFCMGGSLINEGVMLILSYKIGGGPFYFWFPGFCEGVSWVYCILIMTLQKLVPLVFMENFISSFIWFIIFMSLLLGLLGCVGETSLKKFMAFSSIHYVGWLMMCLFLNSFLWVLYLIGYTLILMGVLVSLGHLNVLYFKDLIKMKYPFLFIFSMLNMGGMPPMLGFFLKLWVFIGLFELKIMGILGIILMTMCMFYIYLRVVYILMVNYMFIQTYSGYKSYNYYNFKEWIYISGMIVSPLLGVFFI